MRRPPADPCRSRSRVLSCLPVVLGLVLAAGPLAAQARHPLDPLTAEEIASAAGVLRAAPGFPRGALFSTIVLQEPEKGEVLAHQPGAPMGRRAFSVVLDRRGNRTFEAAVDLDAKRLVSWSEVKGVQPLVTASEYEVLPGIVKADARWRAAMRRRGIDDLDGVQIDGWAVGEAPARARRRPPAARPLLPQGRLRQLLRAADRGRRGAGGHEHRRVVEVEDTGVVPLAPASQELDEQSTGRREAPKPLVVRQPEGAGFRIEGQEVRWQKWRFRYTMHPREGLVLHTVGYEDEGRVRPILYRGSLSEMVVPYGDPAARWRWRSAFDVGEYSVGRLASSIEPGTDAPENATLLDATFAGDDGEPYVLEKAVGIYERDGGLLWKHFESYSGRNESRRARQLVVFFIATIGNYDYGVHWVFHQDGVLEVDAALTGIMLPKGVPEAQAAAHGASPASGHLVAPNVVAPHHQHFFNFRLDLDVDGPGNSVHEMNTRAVAARPGEPLRERLRHGGDRSWRRSGRRSAAWTCRRRAPGRCTTPRARTRWGSDQLHPGAGAERAAVRGPGVVGPAAGGLRQQPLLGDALRSRRDERRGDVSQPEPRRGGAPAVGRGRRAARRPGRGRVVHAGDHAHPPPGGVAGDAGRARRLQADPGGLLRQEPGAGRAPVGPRTGKAAAPVVGDRGLFTSEVCT